MEEEVKNRPIGLEDEADRLYIRFLAGIRPLYYSFPNRAPRRTQLKALAQALNYLWEESTASHSAAEALGRLALAGVLWSRVRPLVRTQADFRLAEQARRKVTGLLDTARSPWIGLDRAMEAFRALHDSEPESIPYPAPRKARTTAPDGEVQA
jgi:hypothetical protein